jgi:hypothetical protein
MNLRTGKPLTIRDAFSWWLRADDLVVAAQVLLRDWREAGTICFDGLPDATSTVQLTFEKRQAHRKLRVVAVAEMLIGMAFECATKAIIIGADQSIVDDKKRWDDLTRDHNLNRYFDRTPLGKSLNSQERGLLDRLQEAIEWRGRYPGSKKVLDVYMQASSEKEFEGWEDIWQRLGENYPYESVEPQH